MSIDAGRTLKPSQSSVWRIQEHSQQDKIKTRHFISCQMKGKTLTDRSKQEERSIDQAAKKS